MRNVPPMVRKKTPRRLSSINKIHRRQTVENLRVNRPVRRLELVLLRIYPRRMIRSDTYVGPVAAACGRDETGLVGIVLWDKQIGQVKVGDVIRIESGWCRQRDGQLVVSTGRNGTLRVLDC
ncbi:MAG: hypothetical protein CMA63_04635 [Euryarchaeota archaeon]|nr:hypothetical protein [Euryarchaeota archaeon]